MKTYTANEELAAILKKNDFAEITSKDDTIEWIRRFRLLGYPDKEILFKDSQIVIYSKGIYQTQKERITEVELRVLILFFKLRGAALKEITNGRPFDFDRAIEMHNSIDEIGKPQDELQNEFS